MSTQTAAASSPGPSTVEQVMSTAGTLAAVNGLAPPGWPRRRAALILPCAARLVTVSALMSADTSPRPGRHFGWLPRPHPSQR